MSGGHALPEVRSDGVQHTDRLSFRRNTHALDLTHLSWRTLNVIDSGRRALENRVRFTTVSARFGGRPVVISRQQVSDRAWTIIGAGITALSVGVSLFAPINKWIGIGGIIAGVLVAAYGVFHDRLYANKLSLVFRQDPPYTCRDASPGYRAEFWVGVRGSRRIPPDVKVFVTNIQPTPSSHSHFRTDYPYSLPQRGQNGDRELLFQLGAAWNNTEGTPFFSGIQMDTKGEPDTFAMDRHETWDVALKVVAADAKSLDAWFSVAPDATGKVRVSRHDWKPITL